MSPTMQRRRRMPSDTPVSLVYLDGQLVSWSCSHAWQSYRQTIEAYTDAGVRGRGLCRTAVQMLVAAGVLNRRAPIAVFSPACQSLAMSIGFADVDLYTRANDVWTLVG